MVTITTSELKKVVEDLNILISSVPTCSATSKITYELKKADITGKYIITIGIKKEGV